MKRNYFYVLFWVFFCLISGSCKIGLGEAIDTESPKINITSPYEGAVIRDKFAIKGTYSDDGKIKSIKLDLNNLVTGQSSTYNAEFTKDSYSFIVDPLKDGVKDGNYLANITITDTYGHSTQVSSPYTIDNTAPVIILSRPESKKGSDSFDMFGQEFKIEGRAHDDNEIEIEVQIFDKGQAEDSTESEVLLLTKTLNNVNRSIELTVLDAKNEPAEYEKVYGKISTDKNETKNLYCKIIAKDSSKRFPVSETEILPTDNVGNVIETYYLESEFEEVIQASYSATDLYKLLNGTFETSERHVDESIKIEDIQKLLNENKISRGQFSLNPANNPNFEVTNFNSPLKKDGKDFDGEDYKLTRGSSITVKVNSGLDGTYIQGKSLGVYVIECDKSGKILENANKIWLIKPEMELVIGEDGVTSTKNIEITEDELALRKAALETQIGVEKSKSYTFKSIELKASKTGMMLGKNYLIFVEGFDSNKTKVSNFTKDYGFYFAPKDAAPSLTLEQPSENTTYLAKGKSLKVKGSSTTEMGSPIIEIRVRDKKVVEILEKELVVKENDDLSNTSTFEYEIPATDFKQDESDEYVVSVVAKMADKETIKEKTISYDVGKPEILIQSVTPVVQKNEKNNLNKIINIKGSVTDSFTGVQTEKLKYSVLQNGEEKLSGGITTPSNFTITIDTASLTDKKDVVIKFYAEDKAGNKEERSETYFVDQSTDIPEIGSNDKSWDAQIDTEQKLQESIVAGNKNNIFTSGGSIVFNIVDDDGISDVTVNDKDYELNGSPLETSVSYVLPTSSGRNKLDVTVKDIFGVEKKLTVWVQVTGAAPKVTLRASPEYFSRNTNKVPGTPDKITISGVNEGADPFKIDVLGEKTDYSSDVITGSDDKNVNWTHSFVPKSKDINKIKYKVSDYWGIFTETEISFKEDSERPVVEMLDSNMPTVAATEASSFKFKGTSSDVGSVVEKVQVSFDGINWQDAVGTNDWSYTSIFAEEEGFETEGEKTIHVRNFDTAGNYSVALSKTFVFDKAVPQLIVSSPTQSNLITTANITFSGKAWDSYGLKETNSVEIVAKKGDTVVETYKPTVTLATSEPETTNWSQNISDLADEKYTIEVKATDKTGKVSVVSKKEVTIDSKKPTATITKVPNIEETEKENFKFSGTANDEGTGIKNIQISFDGTNWKEAVGTTDWSYSCIFADDEAFVTEGPKKLYVRAFDEAGNISDNVEKEFTFDKSNPTLEIKKFNDTEITSTNIDIQEAFALSGNVSDGYGIKSLTLKQTHTKDGNSVEETKDVTITEGTWKVENLPWREGADLVTGEYEYELVATDNADKTTKATLTAKIDKEAPAIEIIIPDSSYKGIMAINKEEFTFAGTTTEGEGESGVASYSYIILPEGTELGENPDWTLVESTTTNWSFKKTIGKDKELAEGSWTIYVKATDKAGNETPKENYSKVSFDVDIKNPVIENVALSPSSQTSTYSANFNINGKIYDTNGIATVKITILNSKDDSEVTNWIVENINATSEPAENNLNQEITVGDDGKIKQDGNYNIQISVTDKVGKETVVTENVTVDRTGPDVEITSHTENDVVNAVKTISGTASDEGSGLASGTYKLYYTEGETTQEISLTAEQCKLNIKANGNWDATIPENTLQNQGKYKIEVSIKDKAGFKTTSSVNIVYDNALPQLKITEPSANSITTNTKIKFSGKVWDTYGLPTDDLVEGNAVGGIQIEIKDSNGEKVGEILKPKVTLATSAPVNSNWTQEITVDSTNGIIKEDGNYTVEVKAVDKVGKDSSLQIFEVLIDRELPKISNNKVNLEADEYGNDGTNTVYNITQIPIILEASDTSSGIQTVEYSTLNSTDDNYADSFRSLRMNNTGTNKGKWTETVTCDWEGTKAITVRAIDKAGNEHTDTINVCIDTTAPNAEKITSDKGESILVDGEVDVSVIIYAADDENSTYNSGIKTVKIIQIGNTKDLNVPATAKKIPDPDDPDDPSKEITLYYECSLPIENLIDDGKVVVEVTDNAKNVTKKDLFDISVDKINPVVKIDNPKDADTSSDGIQVNGKIQLTGTASDNKGLKETKVTLEYSLDNSSWTKIDDVEIDSGTSSWKKEINTRTDFKDSEGKVVADGTKVYIKASATDKAERVGTVTQEIIVDQRTDEPIIKLNNVTKIGEMTSSNSIWHKQEYLYGTVSDDDGDVKELFISSDNGETWSENLLKSGSWEYECNEGEQKLLFKVKDAGSEDGYNVFESNKAIQPKISGTSERSLNLKVDTVQPTIDYIWFRTDGFDKNTDLSETYNKLKNEDSTTGWIVSDSLPRTVVGGPESKLYVMYVSSDANGIRETEAQIKKDDNNKVVSTEISKTTFADEKIKGEIKVVKFDITGLDEKDKNQLKITAYDNATAEGETKGSYTRTIEMTADNTPPTVEFGTMQNVYYGSVGYTINGRRSDTNKITELYFALTKDATEPEDGKFFSIVEYQPGETAWSISFDGRTNDAFSTSFYTKLLNDYLDEDYLYGAGTKEKDEVKEVYLWIYAKDELGNTSEKVHERIQVSPQGDKPSVKIEVPENEKSTGGTIRISGTTDIKTSSVDSVWIQIDPDYNGSSFASDWKTKLENIIGGKGDVGYSIDNAPKYKNNDNEEIPIDALSGGAIKANGEASWNLVINKQKEFEKTDKTNTKVAIKVYAVSKTGKVSNVDEIWFEIDPNSPVIGGAKPLELVQYDSDGTTISARMNYESGMWIKGKWYLTGSVEDDSGIDSITWAENKGTPKELTSTNEVMPNGNNYLLNVPVGSETQGSYGKLEYTLTVSESGDDDKDATQTIVLNYDNQAPEFSATLKESDNEIYQSNGTYSVNGNFTEEGNSSGGNQSGFNRIVMYFTRSYVEGNNKRKYIVDPMISGGESGIENRYQYIISDPDKDNFQKEESDSSFILKNCIYWRKSQANIDENGNITQSSLPLNVRVGGLCMINNVIYRIQTVNGSTVTIDKPITEQTNVDVYFALAQVIDNTTVESGTTEAYKENSVDKDDDTHTNGDGDQMIEGVRINGATYNWTASIDSSLIYDGPITIHFVAFDAAGNMTYKSYGGNVSNNAPRIAGVSFGTDNNGDEKISTDEMITAYSGWYNIESSNKQTGVTQNGKKANGQNVSVFNVGYREPVENEKEGKWETALVVKGNVMVKPEIVGGNTGLGYSVKERDTTIKAYNEYQGVGHSSDGKVRDNDLTIELTVADFLSAYEENTDEVDGVKNFTFSIWDKTEGTTPGVDSQHADINIQMNVMLQDTTPPTVTIDPFYWESKDKNSLYGNSRENGHIELECDLDNGNFTESSGQYDEDPKVSGKITIEGTANDNVLLMELGVKTSKVFGTTKTFGSTGYTPIAKRVNGTWESQGTLADNGWQFEAAEETNTQAEGNTLKWKLHLDTEKVSGTAVADFKLQVQAIDRGSAKLVDGVVKYAYESNSNGNKSQEDSTQTQAGALTNCYQMDIVPYITGIETRLSNLEQGNPTVYNRTALGHYPIDAKETIKIYGFNLDTGKFVDEKNKEIVLGEAALLTTDDSYYGKNGTKYYSIPMIIETQDEEGNIATVEIKSGLAKIVVNSMETLNNKNKNAAKGTYKEDDDSETGDNIKRQNHYNRIPNGTNNNLLTDDIVLDIWEFDPKAVEPKNTTIREPNMKISPATGMMQFAFANGSLFFSMGGGNAYVKNNWGGMEEDTTSHDFWAGSYEEFSSIGFAIDDLGYTYGVAAGGDTNQNSADNFCLFTSRWGISQRTNRGSMDGENALRMEQIGQKNSGGFEPYRKRIKSPSLATTVHGNQTSVYLAYYDAMNKEIRFKSGSTSKTDKEAFGLFKDTYNHHVANEDSSPQEYKNSDVNIVASNITNATKNGYNAREYVSIAVIPGTTAANDVVVLVWYDGTGLYYTYNTAPLTVKGGTYSYTDEKNNGWNTPKKLFDSGIGQYCKITTDKKNGIHVVAYDSRNSDVEYAYASSYNGTWTKCTVDSYGNIGLELSIDVVMDSTGEKPIPYISYYANSSGTPKIAYLVNSNDLQNGIKNDKFNGKWEVSYLPTESTVVIDHVNVGLWKDSSTGKAVNSLAKGSNAWSTWQKNYGTNKTETHTTKGNNNDRKQNNIDGSAYNQAAYGYKFANGTKNPMITYVVGDEASSCIETAQMK